MGSYSVICSLQITAVGWYCIALHGIFPDSRFLGSSKAQKIIKGSQPSSTFTNSYKKLSHEDAGAKIEYSSGRGSLR